MNDKINIATDIPSELFYDIVHFLKDNGWKLTAEYNPEIFDKAIDFDFYEFQKNGETIEMAWDIWCNGEIKTSDNSFKILTLHFQVEFKFGNSVNIKDAIKKSNLMVRY